MDDTTGTDTTTAQPHPHEPHDTSLAAKLNWLRAGVLGANDGIVSTAGLVVGVAAASTDSSAILTAGIAGLAAGAISMAVGEYVSVSTQRDTERALLSKEKRELAEEPEFELAELTQIYRDKGLRPETARKVAEELTAHDAFAAHAEAELGLDPHELTNPGMPRCPRRSPSPWVRSCRSSRSCCRRRSGESRSVSPPSCWRWPSPAR